MENNQLNQFNEEKLEEKKILCNRGKMYTTNILDKIRSIDTEFMRDNPHKDYLNEKLSLIEWDIIVLRNMIDNMED